MPEGIDGIVEIDDRVVVDGKYIARDELRIDLLQRIWGARYVGPGVVRKISHFIPPLSTYHPEDFATD